MKNSIKIKFAYKALFVPLMLGLILSSCKQRDDYPDFSNLEPPVIEEDIIPTDNDVLPITQRIKNSAPFLKTFLMDSTQNVTAGIDYSHIRFLNDLDQKVSMHIVEMDQSKKKVSMVTLSPYDDYLYTTQQLPEMMKMNQETLSSKLMVGIVGDNHSSGTPTGSYVKKGRVIKTSTSLTLPYIGVKKGSSEILFLNSPNATTNPVPAIVPAEYSSLIAGQNWLLFNGIDVIYTTTTTVARTAIGMTADKQKLYAITVDGVNAFSAGISLNNFRTIFKALGCNMAFFTSGSTTNALSVREQDDFILKNKPAAGLPVVANAIGFVVD